MGDARGVAVEGEDDDVVGFGGVADDGVAWGDGDCRAHGCGGAEDVGHDEAVGDDAANKASDEMTSLGIGVVLFAVGLIAAAPTGGLSMAGAGAVAAAGGAELALSIGLAVVAAQRYDMESAESGTDYDKAKVIADRDPDLLWLGLDILGVIGAAAGAVAKGREIFGHLHALREEAISAKAAAAAKKGAGMSEGAVKEWESAAERLRAEGNKAVPGAGGRPGAGDRLKKEVEAGPSMRSGDDVPPETWRPGADYDAVMLDLAAIANEGKVPKLMTREEASAAYFKAIDAKPEIEHGIVQHLDHKEHFVYLDGTSGEVWPAPILGSKWGFERHHHPRGQKFPSAGKESPAAGAEAAEGGDVVARNLRKTTVEKSGDLAMAKQQALKTGEPVTQLIDWKDPVTGEMRTTRFGFNPRSERPFWFEIPGTEIKADYKTLEEADAGIFLWSRKG